MGSTLGSQKSVNRGEKRPYCRFTPPTPPKTRDLDPSSYLPNSLLGHDSKDFETHVCLSTNPHRCRTTQKTIHISPYPRPSRRAAPQPLPDEHRADHHISGGEP